jgi:2-polyprenyl-3-methyl-5-hydroxy-6-metoxy-1,4-benzoquinol methylase
MPESVSCNLCGSLDTKRLKSHSKMFRLPEGFHIVSCKKCGLRYLSPRPTPEEYAAHYAGAPHYSPDSYQDRIKGRTSFYEERLNEFEAMGLKPGTILEVGCATGHFLNTARQRGWKPTGIEISTAMADYGREKFHLNIININDIREANFDEGQFDVVYASNVLEHLPDPISFLSEVNRILKPEGIIFAEVPNQFRHLREMIKVMAYVFLPENIAHRMLPLPHDSIHHCYFFSPSALEKMLTKSGFETISLSSYTPAYFRERFPLRRWGGLLLFRLLDNISNAARRGLLIKVFARKKSHKSDKR